jgi:glycine cleavage system H protein
MNALLSVLESIGIFIAGLVVRFGILVVVLFALAVLFLAGLAVVRTIAYLRRRALGLDAADGLSWKRKGYYAAGHTWVESAGANTVRVGIDDLAQRILGHVTAIALPSPGTVVRSGHSLTEVTCAEKRAMLPSPLEGRIVAVNDAVVRNPSLLNRDPYRRGWLVAVEPATSAYTRLRWGNEARRWLADESNRFARHVEQALQMHAADGGELVAAAPTFLSDADWYALVHQFLGCSGLPDGAAAESCET